MAIRGFTAAEGGGGGGGGDTASAFGVPSFNAPQFDRSKIAPIAQEIALPQIARLRRQFRGVTTGPFANPAQKAFSQRRALSGFGEGLAGITSGARREAVSELMPEYQAQLASEGSRFRAALDAQARQAQIDAQEDAFKKLQLSQRGGFAPGGVPRGAAPVHTTVNMPGETFPSVFRAPIERPGFGEPMAQPAARPSARDQILEALGGGGAGGTLRGVEAEELRNAFIKAQPSNVLLQDDAFRSGLREDQSGPRTYSQTVGG
jgi:hypothetical protein